MKTDPNYGSYTLTKYVLDDTPSRNYTDVPDDAYYKPAVDWATSEGVTNPDGDRFGVGTPLTRAMAVTFLHAYAGGGNGGFNPNGACTREQFVMMLYKLSQAQ